MFRPLETTREPQISLFFLNHTAILRPLRNYDKGFRRRYGIYMEWLSHIRTRDHPNLSDARRANALADLLNWIYTEGQQIGGQEGYSELPQQLLAKVKAKASSMG
jgi:hypothetical protein